MPRVKKPAATAKPGPSGDASASMLTEQDICSPASSNDEDMEGDSFIPGKKRSSGDGDHVDFNNEMSKMLESFGSDISKTLVAKRRRLEQFTQSSTKNTNKKVEEIWKSQQNDRQKLTEEYGRQMKGVFLQWESDLTKVKEQEEKLQHLFQQQQKLFQQTRVVQSQRLKTIKQLHEQYAKGMTDLEVCHTDQQSNVHSELKKEMALLQKRILMDTQQQEMMNVRKSLQSMLF